MLGNLDGLVLAMGDLHMMLVLGVSCSAKRDFLQKKVYDCEGALAEAKADRKESERDRKIHEAVSNLKRLFPGECLTHKHTL